LEVLENNGDDLSGIIEAIIVGNSSIADSLPCAQLNQHILRLVISNYAIFRVASPPPPALSVVGLRPVGKL
jgi:hypothetical protein